MALPTIWIRKNMLQSPTYDHHERQMSESEMRVLRSIQKLSIPQWYLNSSSRPPKILSNDTPIDRRPPSWKNLPVNKAARVAIVQPKISTVCRDGVLETDLEVMSNGNQRFATYKINRTSPTKKSPPSPTRDSPPKFPNMDTIPTTSRTPSASQTFPRISPSRKIQNINIVFPQQPEATKHLQITDLDESDESVPDMTRDSLDVTSSAGTNDQRRRDDTWTLHEDTEEKSVNELPKSSNGEDAMFGSSVSEFPVESSKVFTSPEAWNSLTSGVDSTADKENRLPVAVPPSRNGLAKVTLEGQVESSRTSLPIRTSTPDRKSASRPNPATPSLSLDDRAPKASRREVKKLPGISALPIIHFERASPVKTKPPVSPRTKIPNPNKAKQCDACKGVSGRTKAMSSPRPSSGFRPKSILPSIPEKSCVPPARPPTAKSLSSSPLFNSTKKSSELERIVKSNQRPGKSLVSEIIRELNQRCQISSQPTYVTPASKNFVKKLVTALENGVLPVSREDEENICEGQSIRNNDNYNDEEDYSEDDVFIDSENGSEDDVKSVAVSTSISYKATDSSSSSDTDLASPTMRYNCPYDWVTNGRKENEQTTNNNDHQEKNKNNRDTSERIPIVEKENEDWLYWNKRSEWNLPRTSSLLSVVSKSSSESAERASPCISPIDQSNDRAKFFTSSLSKRSSTWATIYRTKKTNLNRTWRMNETTLLDSGYSDRSSVRSSGSSCNDDKFDSLDCTGTTQTASEGGSTSYFETSHPGRRNRIYGLPIIV